MRTIKFRALFFLSETEEKEWREIGVNHFQGDRGDKQLTEWLQFTGLTDKNGKEIYEGDILDFTFFTYVGIEIEETKRGVIEFNGLAFVFKVQNEEDYELVNLNFDSESDCEVIGNIHENPELINF